MLPNEVIVPAASALAGSGVAGIIFKAMVNQWFKNQDEVAKNVNALGTDMRVLQATVSNFQKSDELIRLQDRALAIVTSKIDRMQQDISEVEVALKDLARQAKNP